MRNTRRTIQFVILAMPIVPNVSDHQLMNVFADNFLNHVVIGQNSAVVFNLFASLAEIVLQLLSLEARQAAQLHAQDGVTLNPRQGKLFHQGIARIFFAAV